MDTVTYSGPRLFQIVLKKSRPWGMMEDGVQKYRVRGLGFNLYVAPTHPAYDIPRFRNTRKYASTYKSDDV